MTQEETLEYNKRCALFLGAIYSEAAEAWGFGNAKNIGSKMFQRVMYHNVIEAERFEKELKFHSDWNWMMEVVEAIVRIPNNNSPDTTLQTRKRDVQYILMSTQKEAVVEAINQFLIWYEQNKTI